jgi:hypothetical protein
MRSHTRSCILTSPIIHSHTHTHIQAISVAKELLAHLIENFPSLGSADFCSEIVGIAFVPVDLPEGTESLLRFCDACLPADRILVWNAMPCLKAVFKLNDVMREKLKVCAVSVCPIFLCVYGEDPVFTA